MIFIQSLQDMQGVKNAPDGLIPYLSQFIIQNHPTI
jgi:hypothetical protein